MPFGPWLRERKALIEVAMGRAPADLVLRGGTWVWTPITSGSVIHNGHATELSHEEAQIYRAID